MNPDDFEFGNDEMPEIEFDAADGGGGGKFKLPPEGKQLVKLLSFELSVSKKAKEAGETKKDQVVLDFESNGVKFKEFLSLNPAALWKLTQFVRAIDPSQDGNKLKLRKEIIGKCFIGLIKHEEYNGRTNAKIQKYEPAPPGFGDDGIPF